MSDTLEDLRERVRCPICKQIFNNPKRLSNCSHVFCLLCIKTYMERCQVSNFPPCPMCRTPILTSLVNIDGLEPARAEIDIIPVVRMYETCDICKQKEHPKQRCLQCDSLICENCKPSHAKFNTFHVLGDVLGPGSSRNSASKDNCKQHPEELAIYFCIMCQSVLCKLCQHATCKEVFPEQSVASRYEVGFLKEFKNSECSRSLSRIVLIKDIASEFKKWLGRIEFELNECIKFFADYKNGLVELTTKTNAPTVIDRIQVLLDTVDAVLYSAKNTHKLIVDFTKISSDAMVAQSFSKIENDCLDIILQRKRYSMETRPLDISLNNQVSKCDIRLVHGKINALVNPYITTGESELGKTDKLMSFWIPEELPSNFPEGIFLQTLCFSCQSHDVAYTYSHITYLELKQWDLYKSMFIEGSNGQHIQSLKIKTIASGCTPSFQYNHYIDHVEDTFHNRGVFYTKFTFADIFGLLSRDKYAMRFKNMLDLICVYDTNGVRKELNHFPDTGLFSLIGSREKKLGLDTVFVYFDKRNGGVEGTNNVCINARKAHFKGVQYPYHTKYDVEKIVDDSLKEEFKMLIARPTGADNDDFTIGNYNCNGKYTCCPGETFFTDDFLHCLDSQGSKKYNIPVKHFQVELLCTLKSGIYYVQKMGDENLIVFGRLVVTEKQVEGKVLFNITQDVSPIEPSKLNPLTMVDGRDGDVVVVCSVTRTTETFVMIRLSKEGDGAIEQLDLHGLESNLREASVIDLEMDSDGNIMYAIQDKDGIQYCGFTKYIL